MKNRILRRFGNNVKKFRKAKDWSQEDLAKKAGLHRTYVGSIERGERNASLINIDKLAKVLGVKIENLMK
ncbi:MAG: helix-turn-helix transcriptional regulator [Thermodesulfobacteriota bacterium]|nr:helix-turn-helix transcriptional regulator [Thermodesulfobacteriota bacterium]